MEQSKRRPAARTRYRMALVATVLLLLPGAVQVAEEEPSAIARRLKAAFDDRSTRKLGSILPSRGRIRVDLPSLAPDASGLLSSSQFAYLLDDLFRRNPVTTLTLEKMPDSPEASGTTLFARLETQSDSGRRTVSSLHIVLADEEGNWILREFRERRRPSP